VAKKDEGSTAVAEPETEAPETEEPKVDKRRGPMSDEQKQKIREKLKEYYQTHEAPMKGRTFTDEQRQKLIDKRKAMKPLGTSIISGRELYTEAAVERGWSDEDEVKRVEAGLSREEFIAQAKERQEAEAAAKAEEEAKKKAEAEAAAAAKAEADAAAAATAE